MYFLFTIIPRSFFQYDSVRLDIYVIKKEIFENEHYELMFSVMNLTNLTLGYDVLMGYFYM